MFPLSSIEASVGLQVLPVLEGETQGVQAPEMSEINDTDGDFSGYSDQDVPSEASPVHEENSDGESHNNVMNTSQSGLGETVTHLRTQSEWGNNLPINGATGPQSGSTYKRPDENRMIGDFDGNDNALWTLYGEKAKSYDEARIGTLKDDMDGVLIFAGLFSAALISFIIDSKQSLKVDPADQTVYYLQQNVALLAQISLQISSIAPQVPIPSAAPPPYSAFHPSPSDIRVNLFWFMALVFSLSVALLATLVQQWVRDYMHVFLWYNDPLKSARLRQYLHEGIEGWYMPVVAEAVPGLLHVSLFLFFAGLCDVVLSLNTSVGVGTIIAIGISGLLYVVATLAQVIYPQAPYKTSFSALIWYLIQKLHVRRYQDDGALKFGGHIIVQRQIQLSMEVREERKGRDERAIRGLIDVLTEDAEMDPFVAAIPGSFNTTWGVGVWKGLSKVIQDASKNATGNDLPPPDVNSPVTTQVVVQHSPHTSNPITLAASLVRTHTLSGSRTGGIPLLPIVQPYNVPSHGVIAHTQPQGVIRELSRRVAHLLETCKNRGRFTSEELWRKRTHGCVETMTLLVSFAGAELSWFGDIGKLLEEIGRVEKTRESSLTAMDRLFATRWTCLSLMVIRPILKCNRQLQDSAKNAVESFSQFEAGNATGDRLAEKNAQKIDEKFQKAWNHLYDLYCTLPENPTSEEARDILVNYEEHISELEDISRVANRMEGIDQKISVVQHWLSRNTHGIARQLPGIEFGDFPPNQNPYDKALNLFMDPLKPLFILPRSNLQGACSLCPEFRVILQRRGDDAEGHADVEEHDVADFGKTLENLKAWEKTSYWPENLLSQQLWRLQDLSKGGGLGFTVELYLLTLKQLLSDYSPYESHPALFIRTFQAITSDWEEYKDSPGTQKVLLAIASPSNGIISKFPYPPYVTDRFLELLENVLKGRRSSHVRKAARELTEHLSSLENRKEFWCKLSKIIS